MQHYNISNSEKYVILLIGLTVILLIYNFINLFKNKKTKTDNKNELRLYYAKWCGHSVNLIENGWKKAKQMLEGKIAIKEIDCQTNNDVCVASNISGFPTIKLFKNGNEIEYSGNRSEQSIVQFVNNNI